MFGEGIYGFLTCVFLHGRGWVFCEFCRFSGRGALGHGWDGDSFFLSLPLADAKVVEESSVGSRVASFL